MHISIKCGKNKRKETYKNEDMGISYVAFSCKTDKTAHRHEKEKRFFMFGMIASVISGILMSLQSVFNTQVTKQTSVWISAGFVQLTALIVCMIAWFVTGREGSISGIMHVRPWYMLLGGVMGAFITYTVILGMNQLGPAKAVLFIIAAQLIAAYIVELFGWFGTQKIGFDWLKLAGVAIFITGIVVFKWKELF